MTPKKYYTLSYSQNGSARIDFSHEVIKTSTDDEKRMGGEDGYRAYHTQDYYELIYFYSGVRHIKVGKSEYRFESGDFFIVSPCEEHAGHVEHMELDRYRLHIYPEAFCDLKDAGAALMRIFNERVPYADNKISLGREEKKKIEAELMALDNLLRFGDSATKDTVGYAMVIELLSELNCIARTDTSKKEQTSALLLQILSYIETSYAEGGILAAIPKSFGISRSGIFRIFRAELGTTPGEYLLKIRLQNAAELLRDGVSVTETAARCGFSDCSHFIKKFKDAYSVTPKRYKAMQN